MLFIDVFNSILLHSTYEIPSAALIGFTDFEIFRRCDIGASNENQKSLQRILERLPFSGETSFVSL